MKKVSIVVPVYNAEKYLQQCIDSIVIQSYKNVEIILVNDGSKDNSLNICKQNANKDSRIKVISDINHGVSYARNQGIKNATGDYIVFIDSDDSVDKNYIYELVNATSEQDYDLIICGYTEIHIKNNKKIEKIASKEVIDKLTKDWKKDYKLLTGFFITPWVKLYKLEIIKKYDIRFPENFKIAEDHMFNAKYLMHISSYNYINKPLYNYIHQDNSSLTAMKDMIAFKCDIECLKEKKKILYGLDIDDKERLLGEWLIVLVHLYSFVAEKEYNTFAKYKCRVKTFKEIVSLDFEPSDIKKKLVLLCLKNDWYLPIYIYNYLKLFL